MLFEGQWVEDDRGLIGADGSFQRPRSPFRGVVGSEAFPAESGRYHLFAAYSCPWAHRTVIARRLKGLEDIVSCSLADRPKRQGWAYSAGIDDLQPESGSFDLHRVYTAADPAFTGRVTVPVLWDRKNRTIVNNESAEILRIFNSGFADITGAGGDLYPAERRAEIDEVNAFVYEAINNGVYRCGFAKTQAAYDAAVEKLFAGLDRVEAILGRQRYLAGGTITEADIRLFTTLVRFDAVYFGHFKCNLRRIVEYPNLHGYLLDLYRTPGFGDTVDMARIKQGYYGTHRHINPSGIVPAGPLLDFTAPHDRARFDRGE